MNKSFYLVLPSNSCPNTQPDNVASRFIIDYENSIQLNGGNWEVALTEFSCVYSGVSLGGLSTIRYKVKHKLSLPFAFAYEDKKIRMVFGDKNLSIRVVDKFLQFSYIKPFTLVLNSTNAYEQFGLKEKKSTYSKVLLDNLIVGTKALEFDEFPFVNGRLEFDEYVVTDSQYDFSEDLVFNNVNDIRDYFYNHCSILFKEMKVDQNQRIRFVMNDNIVDMKMDKNLSLLLGFSKQIFDNSSHKEFIAEDKPKLKASFDHLYIYSNIVEPIHVGHVLVPLLKNVWLENKSEYSYGDIVFQSIDEPMYLPVAASNINKIEINIRDDAGKFIRFSKGSKTNLTLHFKKHD